MSLDTDVEKAELKNIAHINARKWLLLGCLIGQRGNDLLNITHENIKDLDITTVPPHASVEAAEAIHAFLVAVIVPLQATVFVAVGKVRIGAVLSVMIKLA